MTDKCRPLTCNALGCREERSLSSEYFSISANRPPRIRLRPELFFCFRLIFSANGLFRDIIAVARINGQVLHSDDAALRCLPVQYRPLPVDSLLSSEFVAFFVEPWPPVRGHTPIELGSHRLRIFLDRQSERGSILKAPSCPIKDVARVYTLLFIIPYITILTYFPSAL